MRRALALAAALALWGCAGKVVDFKVKIVTAACTVAADPFAGVSYLTVRVTGEGMDKIEANGPVAKGGVTLPEIPAGKARVVQVRAYGPDGPGSKVLSWGQSLPFDVPDVVPEVPQQTEINVFLRKVDGFSPVAAVTSPGDCALMKVPRAGHTATLLANGKVFIAGGFRHKEGTQERIALSDTELFNPQTGAFESARAMSVGTQFVPSAFHTATRLQNGQVLVWGGEQYLGGATNSPNPRAAVLIYDADEDRFGAVNSHASPTTIVRSRHRAAIDKNGKVLIVGGLSRDAANLLAPAENLEWYNPTTATIYLLDSLTLPRLEPAVFPVQGGGLIAVAGGSDGTALVRDLTYFGFDGTTFNKVANGPQLQTARRGAGVGTARDGNDLLLFGGYGDPVNVAPLATTELVATRTNVVGDGPATGARGDACVATLLDGSLLVIGGRTVDALGQPAHSDGSTTLVRPLASGTYSTAIAPALATTRYAHTCTTLADGAVLVLGGLKETAGTFDVLQDAWIYQPPPAD